MPASSALVDSGPLICLFDRSDRRHQTMVGFLKEHRGKLLTNLPVVTECCHYMADDARAQAAFLRWIRSGPLTIAEVAEDDLLRVAELMEKYQDVPMDFADGALVAQAERLDIDRIVTLDSDFAIYRIKRSKPFINLFPPLT